MNTMVEHDYRPHSDEWYVAEYLKYGSVEEVLKAHRYNIYVSQASFHRLVKKFGIIKSCGRREVSLSEILYFFSLKAQAPAEAIEALYSQMPLNFKTSLSTLHRIYDRVRQQKAKRFATTILLHQDTSKEVLMGHEVKTQPLQAKFKGDLSLPMTFCGEEEQYSDAVLRVLQQEVFTKQAIRGELSLPFNLTLVPCMTINILDVEVRVFDIPLSILELNECNSFKLNDYKIVNLAELSKMPQVRSGMLEIVDGFTNGLSKNHLQSELNERLLAL